MTTRPPGEPAPRFSIAEVLDILDGDPARIAAATSGLPLERLHEPLEPGGWSARDILGHIRACDRTWGGYIVRILDEDEPAFRAESPRSTIGRTDFLTQPFDLSLEAFVADRAGLVDRLRAAVDAGALGRTATVTIPARGVEQRTCFHYADRMAVHEREHVAHIARRLAPPR